jgi:hypothetical protein
LGSQCYALLAKAESAAAANVSFSAELINEAEVWLKGVSSLARSSLQESATHLLKADYSSRVSDVRTKETLEKVSCAT